MKKLHWLLLVVLSAAAVYFRLVQLRTGFDEAGLPVSGCAAAYALPGALLLGALFAFLAARSYPAQRELSGAMEDYFDFGGTLPLTICVLGAFALMAGAALSLLTPYRTLLSILLAVFLLCSAVAMLYVLFALRRGTEIAGVALLVPVCMLVLRLILYYRASASDPVLGHHYPEILAIAALTAAFLELSAFAFRNGSARLFVPLCVLTVSLCVCVIPEQALWSAVPQSYASILFYGGSALSLLGFCAAAKFPR